MNTAKFGEKIHLILHDFEMASSKLKSLGASENSADRIGLYLALTANGWPPDAAYAEALHNYPAKETPENPNDSNRA